MKIAFVLKVESGLQHTPELNDRFVFGLFCCPTYSTAFLTLFSPLGVQIFPFQVLGDLIFGPFPGPPCCDDKLFLLSAISVLWPYSVQHLQLSLFQRFVWQTGHLILGGFCKCLLGTWTPHSLQNIATYLDGIKQGSSVLKHVHIVLISAKWNSFPVP